MFLRIKNYSNFLLSKKTLFQHFSLKLLTQNIERNTIIQQNVNIPYSGQYKGIEFLPQIPIL